MIDNAPARAEKSPNLSLKERIKTLEKANQELLNELNQLQHKKIYYESQLALYEKLHQKDKEELKSVQANLDKRMADELADSKLLQQVSGKLIEEENVERLYGQIIDTAKAVMHSDAVSMQVYSSEKRALNLLAWKGFHPYSAKYWEWVKMIDGSICAIAMTEHKRIIVQDIEACDFLLGTEDLLSYRLSGIRSVQSTPLISRSGELLGMISNHWKKVHQPSERDFALLDVINRQAADLLERVRAQTALREKKSWLNGQKEAFQAAMSGLPLTVSLKALVDTVVAQTNGAARAAFYQVPPGSAGLYHIVGMSDEYARDISGFKVGPESLACGLAMYKGEPVISPDIEEDPRWEPLRPLARKYNCRACWSFPVRTKDGPIVGTLGIYFSEPRKPLKKELELAGILAHAAAIIISRDQELMERTQAEEALRENEKKLKMLVHLRDEFIGNASHELNTPLTSMMIYTQILEQHFQKIENTAHGKMIQKLRQQVERLHLLIRDMLDTTRLAEGKMVMVLSHFDLTRLIQEKAEEMQQDTKNHKIVLQLNYNGEIAADEERIGQVITNLISNAIKYSPLGGEIVLSSEIKGNFVKVCVTDYGIGIPAEAFDRIFERFYRVQSNEAGTFPGMGIGLAICKYIIDMHQGKIAVESKEGIGSTLSFTLPINTVESK